jgi:hypothetical protein
MKKIILSLSFVLICAITSFGQSFAKGTKTINLGLNTGYGLGIVGSAEVGVNDQISAGLMAGFSRRSYGYGGLGGNFSISYIVAAARGSYHLGKVLTDAGLNMDKLDPYLGAALGFQKATYGSAYSTYYNGINPLYLSGYGGVRYQLKEKLGLYAEGGWPLSSIGITFKL